MFVSMSRSRSIYIALTWTSFHFYFHFHMINQKISWMQTHLIFCLFFGIWPIIFGWWRGCRMWIIYKQLKFSIMVLLSSYLIFWTFWYCNDVGVTSPLILPWYCRYIVNATHYNFNLQNQPDVRIFRLDKSDFNNVLTSPW